jgi:hypothetical protein
MIVASMIEIVIAAVDRGCRVIRRSSHRWCSPAWAEPTRRLTIRSSRTCHGRRDLRIDHDPLHSSRAARARGWNHEIAGHQL